MYVWKMADFGDVFGYLREWNITIKYIHWHKRIWKLQKRRRFERLVLRKIRFTRHSLGASRRVSHPHFTGLNVSIIKQQGLAFLGVSVSLTWSNQTLHSSDCMPVQRVLKKPTWFACSLKHLLQSIIWYFLMRPTSFVQILQWRASLQFFLGWEWIRVGIFFVW